MGNKLEDMVKLAHDFQVKMARGQVGRKQEELREAENRLQMVRQDDSEARRLVKEMMDLIARAKEQR